MKAIVGSIAIVFVACVVTPAPQQPQPAGQPGGVMVSSGDPGEVAGAQAMGQGSVATCPGGGMCNWRCDQGNCSFACAAGATCNVDCDGGNCQLQCGGGATCNANCDGGNCAYACAGGASCNYDCDGGNCSLPCAAGASCMAKCDGGNCR